MRRSAVVTIRKRLGHPLNLDVAASRTSSRACAGPRGPGRIGRRRCSKRICAPPCC
ncbi:hypothetical protein E9232_003378 [Inquilinus ginsengisoli]|uniref:Uncharacterized protein n=1 Tax=Inquilinus ginsengisoli TaxID=363840 RepID=A0ABU1JQG4_9PROT|nr:hypothetical protein [Inquilinus ginsengisoli]